MQKAAGGDWELPGEILCTIQFFLNKLYSAHLPVGPFYFLHLPTNSAAYLSMTEHNINLLITFILAKWIKAMSYAKPK